MANEQNLKPFPKGVSGNPKGRPKGIPTARVRYQRLLDLMQTVENPITGVEEEFTTLEVMDMKIFAKALKGDIQAYKEIMDRLEGKAQQSMDITSGHKPLPIMGGTSELPDDNSLPEAIDIKEED